MDRKTALNHKFPALAVYVVLAVLFLCLLLDMRNLLLWAGSYSPGDPTEVHHG